MHVPLAAQAGCLRNDIRTKVHLLNGLVHDFGSFLPEAVFIFNGSRAHAGRRRALQANVELCQHVLEHFAARADVLRGADGLLFAVSPARVMSPHKIRKPTSLFNGKHVCCLTVCNGRRPNDERITQRLCASTLRRLGQRVDVANHLCILHPLRVHAASHLFEAPVRLVGLYFAALHQDAFANCPVEGRAQLRQLLLPALPLTVALHRPSF